MTYDYWTPHYVMNDIVTSKQKTMNLEDVPFDFEIGEFVWYWHYTFETKKRMMVVDLDPQKYDEPLKIMVLEDHNAPDASSSKSYVYGYQSHLILVKCLARDKVEMIPAQHLFPNKESCFEAAANAEIISYHSIEVEKQLVKSLQEQEDREIMEALAKRMFKS